MELDAEVNFLFKHFAACIYWSERDFLCVNIHF